MRWLGSSLVLLLACGGSEPAAPETPAVDDLLDELDGLTLPQLMDAAYRAELRRDPEAAVELGMADELGIPDAALTPISEEEQLEDLRLIEGIAMRIDAMDDSALSASQRLDLETYRDYLDDRLAQRPFLRLDYPVNHFLTGAQNDLEFFFTDVHQVRDEREARAYLARLRRVGDKMKQIIELVDLHEAAGAVLPKFLVDWAMDGIRSIAQAYPRETAFYTSFAARIDSFDPALRTELLAQASDAIEEVVIPAYVDLLGRMTALRANAPDEVGVGRLPDGQAYYAYLLRHHTTTELTAEQIHTMGTSMLDEIHADLRARFEMLGYDPDASLADNFDRVQEDGGIVPRAEVGAAYEEIIRDAESRLTDAFDLVPSPEWSVKVGAAGGFYQPGSLDGDRPGVFYASDFDTPRFEMRTLAYHEVTPGHHFQISVAHELDQTLFRRVFFHTAYVEGWALYAERLAGELGWYADDPYGDLGRLQAAAFRATRLVVDTGIHAMGWTFDDAVAFMVENTGMTQGRAQGEVARYSVWPGQATAYAIGMNELVRIRTEEQRRLGAAFDLTAFHHAVLTAGSVPLPLLERTINP